MKLVSAIVEPPLLHFGAARTFMLGMHLRVGIPGKPMKVVRKRVFLVSFDVFGIYNHDKFKECSHQVWRQDLPDG